MTNQDELERDQRESLMALDGFMVAVTPLPYEFEEFSLQISSKKIGQQLEKLINDAGIKTLTADEYAAADAPASLGISVEVLKTERGSYIYLVRADVTQLVILERDYKRQRTDLYAATTWMSPRLIMGEVSSQIFVERITEQMQAVARDFIEAYKQAQSELQL